MLKINERKNIKWLHPESQLTLFSVDNDNLIDKNLVTSVFCFIKKNDKVLFIKNKKPNRGEEIPGGHVDPGEDPISAVIRECYEEACVKISNPQLFAIHEINNSVDDGKYPLKGYQFFYVSEIDEEFSFIENEEIESRAYYGYEELLNLEWSRYYEDLVKLFTSKKNKKLRLECL